jgi:transcriptional regulator with XRE-family HTH domain
MPLKKQPPPESVGARIRALRLAANLTQDEFASKLNVERIAKVLNTSLGYLVSGEAGSLQGDELALVRLYRACSTEDRRLLVMTARRLARS